MNAPTETAGSGAGTGRRRFEMRLSVAQRGILVAIAIFAVMFMAYAWKQPGPLTANIVNTASNKGALLALVAMAQTLPVLVGGLDLSVGAIFVLANCLASTVVVGNPVSTTFGILAVLLVGLLCGTINGAIIVYGRLQPLIVTLAMGAVYFGISLALRPQPGGSVNFELADFMTNSTLAVPHSAILLLLVVLFIWIPYRRSVLGRAAYAIGSAEQAAYMSGVPIERAKILAFALSGLLAAIGGLLLTAITYSGAAKLSIANDYTLNSIGAVVIGGTSLFGGVGSAIGSIFGAFVMRTVGDLLIVFDINPVLQPLFVGIVLLVAVCMGSLRVLRIKNKLDLYR
ncbi:ABC transporter permease [Pelagibius marinus]|uniref:ABC transporter permease n=1 Tax=Pelagibius marinus TaxID=2762760 RepID=UPI002AC37031|nr:ABC transporter permease [Pelagibius marinus]